MILSEGRLREKPAVFRAMTGLQVAEFDGLAEELVPAIAAAAVAAAEAARREKPKR